MSQEIVEAEKEIQQPETDMTDSEKLDYVYHAVLEMQEQTKALVPVIQNLGNSPMGAIFGSLLR